MLDLALNAAVLIIILFVVVKINGRLGFG